MADGKIDHREELREKYYLSDKQFRKLAPPDLTGTKLYMIEGFDFSGLSNRLFKIHR